MAIRHLPPTPDPYNRETFEEKAWNFLTELAPWGQEVDAVGQQVAADMETTEQLKADTQEIKDAAVAETTQIKNDGVAAITEIKDAAVAETTQIKNDGIAAITEIKEETIAEATELKNETISETTQIKNDAVAETTAIKDIATQQKEAAIAAKESAIQARDEAWRLTHYKGGWSGLSGALAIPASVSHNDCFWGLTGDVDDVAQHEPGESGKWQRIYSARVTYISSAPGDPEPTENTFAVPIKLNDSISVDIAGLGRFVWEPGATDPAEYETCLLNFGQEESAPGRWLLVEPSWEGILAEAMRINDETRYKMETQE